MAQDLRWNSVARGFGSDQAMVNASRNLSNVSTIASQTLDRNLQQQKLKQDRIESDKRLNLLNQANTRQQASHDATMTEQQRLIDQRNAGIELSKIANPVNTQLTADVNNKFVELNKKYEGQDLQNDPVARGNFDKELNILNQGLYTDLGDGQSIDNTKADYTLNRDPSAFKEQALAQLMNTGKFTKAEADSVVASELASRYPVNSAENIKAEREMNETIYKENMAILKKGIGSGSGMTVNEDGTISVGKGNKTVSTQKDNPTLISNTIEKLAIGKDITGKISGTLFGETRPTTGNLNKTVTVLKNYGYDDTQIARGLEAGVKENWLIDDALADPATIASYMGKPSASSVRTTNDGGSRSNSVEANNVDIRKQMALLTKNFQENDVKIAQSGLRGTADKTSLDTFFNGPKVVDTKKSSTSSDKTKEPEDLTSVIEGYSDDAINQDEESLKEDPSKVKITQQEKKELKSLNFFTRQKAQNQIDKRQRIKDDRAEKKEQYKRDTYKHEDQISLINTIGLAEDYKKAKNARERKAVYERAIKKRDIRNFTKSVTR